MLHVYTDFDRGHNSLKFRMQVRPLCLLPKPIETVRSGSGNRQTFARTLPHTSLAHCTAKPAVGAGGV